VRDGATTLDPLRTWGCGLRSFQEPWIDTTTPIGEAMFRITIARAGLDNRRCRSAPGRGWRGPAKRAS
jgi:hypothetical protein